MKRLTVLLFTIVLLTAAFASAQPSNDHAALKRQMLEFERAAKTVLQQTFDGRPFAVLEDPKAVYLEGFGVMVHTEVNLYPTSALGPFLPAAQREAEFKNEREQKILRLKQLQGRVRELLLSQSGSLGQLGPDENIALVVHLFNLRQFPEIPSQIVLQARRQALVSLQTEGRKVGPEDLAKVISLREF